MSATDATLALRRAGAADVPAMTALIEASVRGLSQAFYTAAQIESGIRQFGVDTTLVNDGTYFCVEADGTIVGCGGWSMRQTHYGGDHAKDAADPDHRPGDRAGAHSRLLRAPIVGTSRHRAECSTPAWTLARAAGFSRMVLSATLPGVPLYQAYGFTTLETFDGDTAGWRGDAHRPHGTGNLSGPAVARRAVRRDEPEVLRASPTSWRRSTCPHGARRARSSEPTTVSFARPDG